MTTLTLERLKELLEYNPDTGLFIRKVQRTNQQIGSVAGSFYRYCTILVDNRSYLAHRLAWFYMTGNWPTGEIDHINGVKLDNRWGNLRDGTKSQNVRNRPAPKNNSSGYKGVTWNKFNKRWLAQGMINCRKYHFGYFDSAIEAHQAYQQGIESITKSIAQ